MAEKQSVLNFLDHLRSSARPSKAAGTVVDVFHVTDDPLTFVRNHLDELRENGLGIFSRLKHRKGDAHEPYFEYQCERHNKPRGKSSGVSTETRANRCTAFVSFKFVHNGEYTGCIRRLRSHHTGHDPTCIEEKCVGMIDKNLVSVIETLAFNGKKAKDILQAAKVWSMEQGHTDFNDRRYYPKAQDIHNILKAYRKHLQFHKDDLLCVEQLLQGDLSHSCLYCQLPSGLHSAPSSADPSILHDESVGKGLCVILRSPEQAGYLQSHGGECRIAYLTICRAEDANPNSYNNKANNDFLLCILGIPDNGCSVPVASFLVDRSTNALVSAFQVLKDKYSDFSPSAFMMDQNELLSSALQQVWPESVQLWSWYNVLQSLVVDLASNCKSGLSGSKSTDSRHMIVMCMWQLKQCTKESQYEKLAASLLSSLGKKGQTYLQTNWLSSGQQWSDFGRMPFVEEGTEKQTKMADLDRNFVKQKLLFSSCQTSQKLDCVVLMLMHMVQLFFKCLSAANSDLRSTELTSVSQLHNSGPHVNQTSTCGGKHPPEIRAVRGIDPHDPLQNAGAHEALCLLHMSVVQPNSVPVKREVGVMKKEKGQWSRAVWLEDGVCVLPSEDNVLLSWRVDFVMGLCSCPSAIIQGTCRHVQADTSTVFHRLSPSLQNLREKAAEEIICKRTFHQSGNSFLILHTDRYLSSLVVMKDSVLECSCCSFMKSNVACVCKLVVTTFCPDKNLLAKQNGCGAVSCDSVNVSMLEKNHGIKCESVAKTEDDPLCGLPSILAADSQNFIILENSEHVNHGDSEHCYHGDSEYSEQVIEEVVLTTEHHQADLPEEVTVDVSSMSAGTLSELLLSLSSGGQSVVVGDSDSAAVEIPNTTIAAVDAEILLPSNTAQPSLEQTGTRVSPTTRTNAGWSGLSYAQQKYRSDGYDTSHTYCKTVPSVTMLNSQMNTAEILSQENMTAHEIVLDSSSQPLLVATTSPEKKSSRLGDNCTTTQTATAPLNTTQTAKRCLDDLVRRLELRQLATEEESTENCLPTPVKRQRTDAQESDGERDATYLVQSGQGDNPGEIIYIVAL